MPFKLATIILVAGLSGVASACWEQCGGQGWAGPIACPGDCVCTYSNPWYSQCLPPTTTGTTSTTSITSKTTSSSTTIKTTSSSTTSKTTSSSTTSKTTSSATTSSTATPGGPKYIFSFGDSYTQTGFESTGTLPNAANPLGNPTYPGYTACGSVTNWIDVVTAKYNTSLVYTYNYAYGGATIDATLVAPYTPTVKSLIDQINIFLPTAGTHPAATPWTSANSLFSFFIGINDIGNSWYNSGDRAAFSDTLLNAYFAQVQKAYDVGGRNFLFVNVPGVDRSPLMLAQSQADRDAEKAVIDGFNTKLTAKVAAFQSSHAGTKTWVYNANAKLVSILNSPSSYGFQDATSFGSATNLAWCNNYHISTGVHEFYGKDVATLITGGFF